MMWITIIKSTKPIGFKGRWCELADKPCRDQSKRFIGCTSSCPNNSEEIISEKELKGYIKTKRVYL